MVTGHDGQRGGTTSQPGSIACSGIPCSGNGTLNADGTCSCFPGYTGVFCENSRCAGVVCTASDQYHVAGVCDPTTGQCTNPPAPDGTACNDGNSCTQSDTCQAGRCVGSNPVICTPSDSCHTATCDSATGTCPETPSVGSCKSGKIKSGPCDCDGTCCPTGSNCVGKPGERRCKEK